MVTRLENDAHRVDIRHTGGFYVTGQMGAWGWRADDSCVKEEDLKSEWVKLLIVLFYIVITPCNLYHGEASKQTDGSVWQCAGQCWTQQLED